MTKQRLPQNAPKSLDTAMSALKRQYQQQPPQASQSQYAAQQQSAEIPTDLKVTINKVVQAIDGMYQFSGLRDNDKSNNYKTELTKGLYSIRDRIDEHNLKAALDYFRTQGGKFPPSVPEFIQAVLGQHQGQTKPPEHVWFDASKALPKHSAEQMAEFARQGIADARAALKKRLKR